MLWSMDLKLVLLLLQRVLCVLSSSQGIERLPSGIDAFPNPDGCNAPDGCGRSRGFCSGTCCRCQCMDDYTYVTQGAERCVWNGALTSGQFAFHGSRQRAVKIVAPNLLRKGLKIGGCSTLSNTCTRPVTECIIEASKATYDNNGTERLWAQKANIDFRFINGSLTWIVRECDSNKYDGLLMTLWISCRVDGGFFLSSPVVFKVQGNFSVGTNPSTRGKCTVSTTANTKKATKTDQIHTTMARKTAAATTQKTNRIIPTTTPARTHSPVGTTTDTKRNSTKATTTHIGVVSGKKAKRTASSKKIIITAVSASVAGLLLIVLISIAVKSYFSRRRYFQSNPGKRLENQRARSISGPLPLDRSLGFPPGMEDKMGYWTIDVHGEFVVIDHTPAFTVHSRESSCDVEDDIYDQPITRSESSIDKLYSKVDKNWRKNQKENDDGYASIDDISVSANAGKSLAMKHNNTPENRLAVARSPPITEQKKATPKLRQDTRTKIFEMQNIGFDNSGFVGHDSEIDWPNAEVTRDSFIDINPVYEGLDSVLQNKEGEHSYEDNEPEYMLYEPSGPYYKGHE
eukprot:Seg1800.3 transcript_id=Seg1800.3/GoldUCD/mRNA.D3Y31 product="hypothetical protein" protein_id=Seg1800.3/GoldUCD/D3Y31